MIAYYGTKISPNQLETGEGFLICKNVPIARTGDMDYMASELGLDGDKVITVHRAPEDVFSPAALASFEGKPVTSDHPPALVTPEDVLMYERGHAQNVRRGTGEFADYVLADLHIHDGELIREIRDGKREISCGYECEYLDNGDGTYSQKNIIGNHVAVVDAGRAGHKAAILDAIKELPKTAERKRNMSKNAKWFSLFGKAVKDATPDEIERMALDTAELMGTDEVPAGEAPAEEAPKTEAPADEAPAEKTVDEKLFESIDALTAKMDAILEALAPKKEEEPKDPIDEAIEILSGAKEEKAEDEEAADPTGEEAVTVPAEEMNEEKPGMDSAAALALLKAVRPAIAEIKDEAQRKAVSDAVLGLVSGKSDAAKLVKAKPAAPASASIEDVQKMYDRLNPHKKEVN